MFELLFKYPPAIFSRGKLVLLASWPWWVMLVLIAGAAAGLFWNMKRRETALTSARSTVIWAVQTALIALLLFMLWHPAISVARLRPQQNVVAVMVDHSRSMGLAENGKTRLQAAQELVANELLPELGKKFQVRLYEFGHDAARVDSVKGVAATDNATRLGDSLKHIASEAGAMPLGAVVMLTDGGDNTGGVDRETIAQLRQLRLPVHTVGFGPDHFNKDIEIEDTAIPARAMPNSRLVARVTLRQHGYAGEKVNLTVRENGHPLAQRQVTLKGDAEQSETIMFNSGVAGAHSFQVGIDPAPGEENKSNNGLIRLVNVTPKKMRILYMEGEPRWEYKFIRRAVEDDQTLDLVSVVRTTQNKTYQQGGQQGELTDGVPPTQEGMDKFDGLIIGSMEANYFSPAQQNWIRDFADKRGGGVLFLAGRYALNDGGYSTTPMAEMMPLRLSADKTFVRNFADVSLTPAGRESVITRLVDDRDANVARWKAMPQVVGYSTLGAPKPGAVVLMESTEQGRRPVPLLTIQNYGHGRTGIFATGGSWRWQMLQDHTDQTHEIFWQQLMRWLVSETPGMVTSSIPHQVLSDETNVTFRASVRNKIYDPVAAATVDARITRPDGGNDTVVLAPDPLEPGTYTGSYTAQAPGSYVAEVVAGQDKAELGRDTITFRREDGVAENFGAAQNKDLLQKLSADTGANYYTPEKAKRLGSEISVSEAGITAHDNLDIWDMPILFLLVLLIRGGEWLLRRKWGVV